MSATKIGGTTTDILNCYFSSQIYTLCTSGEISTSGKLNFLPISSIYLVFSPQEMWRRLMWNKIYYKFFYSVWNVSQTFKSSSSRKVFLKCVYHWYNLLRRMFLVPCDNRKTLFFIQIYHYPEIWHNHHAAVFFETSVLKEVRILHPLSPH